MEGYTSRRPGGRPAILIMHPVNWGVGVPGIWGIRGAPGIMGTENGPSLRKAITVRVFFTVLISAILLGSCAVKQKAELSPSGLNSRRQGRRRAADRI